MKCLGSLLERRLCVRRSLLFIFLSILAENLAAFSIERESTKPVRDVAEARKFVEVLRFKVTDIEAELFRANTEGASSSYIKNVEGQLKLMKDELTKKSSKIAEYDEWENKSGFDEDYNEGVKRGLAIGCGICTTFVQVIRELINRKVSEGNIHSLLQSKCPAFAENWQWGEALIPLHKEYDSHIERICNQVANDFSADLIDAVSTGEDLSDGDDGDLCRVLRICDKSKAELMAQRSGTQDPDAKQASASRKTQYIEPDHELWKQREEELRRKKRREKNGGKRLKKGKKKVSQEL